RRSRPRSSPAYQPRPSLHGKPAAGSAPSRSIGTATAPRTGNRRCPIVRHTGRPGRPRQPIAAGTFIVIPGMERAPNGGIDGMQRIEPGDVAWMLVSTALVLLMTIPGLALFYAGMVRKKNVLATMM